MSVWDKLQKNKRPHKLLALDGGGMRGVITIEILAEIEQLLQHTLGRDDSFVLADYFDYMAGTSTGAILATCLALGWRVERLRQFYHTKGKEMFDYASLFQRFHTKYNAEPLAALLQQEIGLETTQGSDKLKTLLLLILRNATTDSPWPLSNNPHAKYNQHDRPNFNLHLPLWQLVRASTAAPTYFPPEVISMGGEDFVFVDGGVTMYNNPAFQLFLMATVEPFRLCWPTGVEHMLLVSIGTGTSPAARSGLRPDEMHLLFNASSIPSALMFAALNEQDFLCRVFGDCLVGDPLDREVYSMIAGETDGQGKLVGHRGPIEPKLFTYLRYNAELTREGLDMLGLPQIKPQDVQRMDSVDHVLELQQVGAAVAHRQVDTLHFAKFS